MPCEVCKNRSIVEIQYCMECGENAFGQNLYEPKPTFRTKTCGECAWAIHGSAELLACRRCGGSESDGYFGWPCVDRFTPACPAFVAKEEG